MAAVTICSDFGAQELTHWKRPWCWERLKAGGEEDNRGWDGWVASLTQWTWVWAALGVGDGQGSLGCCHPWGGKESDRTEWLNWRVTKTTWCLPTSAMEHIHLCLPGFPVVLCTWKKGKALIQCLCVNSFKTKNRIPVCSICSFPHRPLRHWHRIGFYSVTYKC